MRGLFLCVSIALAFARSDVAAQDFEEWLGPQGMSDSFVYINLETKEDREKHIPELKCSLKVMRGKDIKFPESKNPAFTVRDGKFAKIDKCQIADDRLFLVGIVDRQRGLPGHNYYIIRATVTEGKLKGAIINFLNEKSRHDTGAPTASAFEVPDGVELKEGEEISFEIRQVYRKGG